MGKLLRRIHHRVNRRRLERELDDEILKARLRCLGRGRPGRYKDEAVPIDRKAKLPECGLCRRSPNTSGAALLHDFTGLESLVQRGTVRASAALPGSSNRGSTKWLPNATTDDNLRP